MSGGLLRRAWPSIRWGVVLGCGAAFAGSWAFTLLFLCLSTTTRLVSGVPLDVAVYVWQFILAGVALCFIASVLPGSLGGGGIALALHIVVRGNTSLPRLGARVGYLAGGLAGVVTVLLTHVLFGFFLMPVVILSFGSLSALVYYGMVPFQIGIALLAGGGVGRWLASHESGRIARQANTDSRDQDRVGQ